MLTFTDRVIANIEEHIARYPAERGGALLTMIGSNVVAGFEPDPKASVTSASYTPSAELTERVQWRETNEGLSFCGVVHSHPGTFDQPSTQDDVAFRKGLDLNPHLAAFVAPIVTHDAQNHRGRSDECLIARPGEGTRARARMRLYIAYRSDPDERTRERQMFGGGRTLAVRDDGFGESRRGGGNRHPNDTRSQHTYDRRDMAGDDALVIRDVAGLVRLKREPISIMPLDQEIAHLIEGLSDAFRVRAEHKPGTVSELRGQPFLNEVIRYDLGEIQLLFPTSFPTSRPILLCSHSGGGPMQMVEYMDWGWSLNDEERPGFLWRRMKPVFESMRRGSRR